MNLLEACMKNDFKSVQEFTIQGEDLNQQFDLGATALMVAVQEGNRDIVLYLLEHGANPNIRADGNVSPLMIAAARNNLEIAQILVQFGAETAYPA